MLEVASHIGNRSTLCSDVNVFNSKNPHCGFPAILDSGATSGFAPTRNQKHMIRVLNLKTPVKVKLGTSISYALQGSHPNLRSKCNRQTRLSDLSYGVLPRR